jgi:hypothetical protein
VHGFSRRKPCGTILAALSRSHYKRDSIESLCVSGSRSEGRQTRRGQVARQPQLLRKFFLLDSGGRLFRNLVRDRGLWLRCFGSGFLMAFLFRSTRRTERSGGPAPSPFLLVNKAPDGPHQMRHGNVNAALSENLRDSVDAEPAAVRLQDLFLILSQCVDLGLFTITAAFRAAGDFEKILGSGFEMIRISQCESPRVFRVYDKERSSWRSN